jgi:hypothetical protein
MKRLFAIFAFVILPYTAIAGEWVLWRCEFISGSNISPPIPRSEHKTLKACHDASAQNADSISSWAKKNDEINVESVMRFVTPDGALYNYKNGNSARTEFRCYPYGVVPTQNDFQSKARQ